LDWGTLISLWPILVIAVGFDILVGKRSLLASLAGMALVLVILFGALWYSGARIAGGQPLGGEQVSQPLDGATQANLTFEPGAGEIRLEALTDSNQLVAGRVPDERGYQVSQGFSQSSGTANLALRSEGAVYMFPNFGGDNYLWDLGVTNAIPVNLKVNLGAGQADLNLADLQAKEIEVDLGVGFVTVDVPEQTNANVSVDGAIGQLVIIVPAGSGVRVDADTAMVNLNLPDDFREQNGAHISSNYESADYKIDLHVGLAIGDVQVRTR
jgi:hypothetical protein